MLLEGQPKAIFVMPYNISESTFLIACNVTKKEIVQGVVYVYKGTELLHILYVQEPIQAFIYGTYGFGEEAFIFNTAGKLRKLAGNLRKF